MQKPDRKITSASVSAAAATVVVYVAGLLGLDMAPEVAAAFVTVATAVAGYFTPSQRGPAGDAGEPDSGLEDASQ